MDMRMRPRRQLRRNEGELRRYEEGDSAASAAMGRLRAENQGWEFDAGMGRIFLKTIEKAANGFF
jgi:hypothetical protein